MWSALIRGRLLNVIDHEYFYWTLGGLQLQTQLLLNRCEDRGAR